MSASICTDCLARLRITKHPLTFTSLTKTHASPFHSSPAQYKSPLLKKKVMDPNKTVASRRATGVRLKKKVRQKINIPAVGERRAARKRIVLSNTNALEVYGMETLSVETIGQEESLGRMMAFPGELLDQLRDSQAFKTTQNWNLFRRPATMIRSETLDIAKNVEEVDKREGKNVKYLVTGERGSGKSILMLQAMSMAFMKKWVVLSIPEGHEFTNNTSFYAPVRKTSPSSQDENSLPGEQLYNQSHLAQALLTRAANANQMVLSTLKLNHLEQHLQDYPKLRIKPKATMRDIALLGAQDATNAVSAWKVFWKELNTAGNNPRPPVLVAVDGVDHWFGLTKYRNADYNLIHAQQFTLIKQLTDLFFSLPKTPSPLLNGGLLLYTTSGSNSPKFPSFEALIEQIQATERGVNPKSPEFPLQDPYSKPDVRVTSLVSRAGGISLLDVNGTSQFESRGILDYFARSGLLQKPLSEQLVSDFRQLSAGGIIGELAKLGARVKA
ncbi:uncharacterized protein A1O9_11927 [Exophiala aquamarina CBS 119918]|uniref:Small ribosomal subunit protein mS29 n=1 Tax=Exophiala aquamarina CBS 119918 TaxID=1182545 RepID=A0A072NWY5_9EURO|nr:uncharacterized protein A1O9_11927 [Exophiala aquamarina CBS 119918]KEF51937.1 hypothetical protein A1O9_11927 [Exophiala aquamarina CBS 119918]